MSPHHASCTWNRCGASLCTPHLTSDNRTVNSHCCAPTTSGGSVVSWPTRQEASPCCTVRLPPLSCNGPLRPVRGRTPPAGERPARRGAPGECGCGIRERLPGTPRGAATPTSVPGGGMTLCTPSRSGQLVRGARDDRIREGGARPTLACDVQTRYPGVSGLIGMQRKGWAPEGCCVDPGPRSGDVPSRLGKCRRTGRARSFLVVCIARPSSRRRRREGVRRAREFCPSSVCQAGRTMSLSSRRCRRASRVQPRFV